MDKAHQLFVAFYLLHPAHCELPPTPLLNYSTSPLLHPSLHQRHFNRLQKLFLTLACGDDVAKINAAA
jgi:hypothetical protein